MGIESIIYTLIAVPISIPALIAGSVLRSRTREGELDGQERLALRLLFAQSLVPAIQFLLTLNIHVDRPDHGLRFVAGTLLLAAVALFVIVISMLVSYCRGVYRVFWALLSLVDFAFSVLIFLTLFATA